jgi:ferredoxin
MPQIVFVRTDGTSVRVSAKAGTTVLEAAHAAGIEDLEGACEGCLSCSTCHVIVAGDWFDRLPEPEPEEETLLDFAFGLQRTSRLGCQIRLTDDLDGIEVRFPPGWRNMLGG